MKDRDSLEGLTMRNRIVRVAWVLVLCAAGLDAQTTLGVPAAPVSPGVPFTVVLTDNSPSCIDILVTNVLTLLQPTGEVITPELVGCGPISICPPSGQPISLTYSVPASGPGSSGSYVLLCPYGTGAAARLDVVTPSAGFPDIHAFPALMPHGPGAHHIEAPATPGSDWSFCNTAPQSHAISPTIAILTPGGSVPVASASPALVVPANGVVQTSLPIAGLAAGPYTVEVQWFDPGVSGFVTVRHGIEISSGVSIDLHLPGGKLIPSGGALPARLVVRDSFAVPFVATWSYALCVGVSPGSTQLPGGAIVPLVPDPFVLASITNGIGGLLTNNVGVTTLQGVYCAHGVTSWSVASGIAIAHPNVPGVSGLGARVAVVAIDPAAQVFIASQPEDVTLQ
jgi:hypothetical protein